MAGKNIRHVTQEAIAYTKINAAWVVAKEFNDNLSGLDEISNIDTSASGLSAGLQSQLNALDEFQKKIAEVDEWLEKTGIRKWIQDIGKFLGDLWNGFKNQPEWLKWLEAGLGVVGLLLLKLGGGTGLYGLLLVLAGVSLVSLYNNIKDIIDACAKAEKAYKDLMDMADGLKNQSNELRQDFLKLFNDPDMDWFSEAGTRFTPAPWSGV